MNCVLLCEWRIFFWLEEKGIGAEEMRCNGVDGENYENFDNVEGGGAEAFGWN